MFESRAHEYRRWATQCLSMAGRAMRDEDKTAWLALAGKWQRLADRAASNHAVQQAQQPSRKCALSDEATRPIASIGRPFLEK